MVKKYRKRGITMNNKVKTNSKLIGFIQIEKKGMITVLCQSCSRHFGLDPKFVENVSEIFYEYACPYCGRKHILRD